VKPIVFDDTAMVALFDAHPYVLEVYHISEVTGRHLLFPATAVLAANFRTAASADAWEAILLGPHVVPLDLTAAGAITASSAGGGDPTVAHCIAEATAAQAAILTNQPDVYRWRKVPTLPF